jgi:hypothetical protein
LHQFVPAQGYGAIELFFANSQPFTSRLPAFPGTPVTSMAASCNGGGEMDLIGVGQDQNLYHWRFLNGQWKNPTMVPFPPMTASSHGPFTPPPGSHPTQPRDPSSHASRPSGGGHPRTPSHANQFPGTVFSAPILVDTGAGQLELLAVAGYFGEHDLYRWRFAFGSWTQPQKVNTGVSPTFFGQTMASSWGDGTTDFTVVDDTDGSMRNARLLPTPDANTIILAGTPPPDRRLGSLFKWPLLTTGAQGDFINVGGKTIAAPAIIAYGPNRLQLLAIGTDGYLYDNQTQASSVSSATSSRSGTRTAGGPVNLPQWGWSGFRPLTNVPVTLGTAAQIADRESAVAVNVGNGRILINYFRGSRWSDFFPVSAPVSGVSSSIKAPALAVH